MPKFRDIPQFIQGGDYSLSISWTYLENWFNDISPREDYFDLDPDFQRAHVWTEEKQRRYVEYILKGGTSSKRIYWNCPNWVEGPIVLVDGKQRLEAVRKFLRNELPIFGGNYFKDYEDNLDRNDHFFFMCVNKLQTKKEVLQWYLDLNEGGVVHTKEELDKVREMLNNIE